MILLTFWTVLTVLLLLTSVVSIISHGVTTFNPSSLQMRTPRDREAECGAPVTQLWLLRHVGESGSALLEIRVQRARNSK